MDKRKIHKITLLTVAVCILTLGGCHTSREIKADKGQQNPYLTQFLPADSMKALQKGKKWEEDARPPQKHCTEKPDTWIGDLLRNIIEYFAPKR